MSDPLRTGQVTSLPPPDDDRGLFVTLRAGQTLEDVERLTGFTRQQIFEANRHIESLRQLGPGQRLRLPGPISEPLEQRLAPARTWARPAREHDENRRALGPQVGPPLRHNPYQDTVETLGVVTGSLGGAVGANLAGQDPTPARQLRSGKLGRSVETLATVALAAKAGHRQAVRLREIEAAWDGLPVRGYRADADFGQHVVRRSDASTGAARRSVKAFVTDQGNLRPADPDGRATPIQHVRGQEPAKSHSPFTSIKVDRSSGKYFGGPQIEIDLAAIRRDIASGRLTGVRIVEHRELMTLHAAKVAAAKKVLARAPDSEKLKELVKELEEVAGFSRRDQEALIVGTLPARYFRRATPGRDLEPKASRYERQQLDVAAEVRTRRER